ncbi:MAG: hypothetical protein H0T52_06020 [Lautropia sp.]|nr:hypothetical protein [Lautropia sp.]
MSTLYRRSDRQPCSEGSGRFVAGLLLTVGASLSVMAPDAAWAQGSSALFAVGEGKSSRAASRAADRPVAKSKSPAPVKAAPVSAAAVAGQADRKASPAKSSPAKAAASRKAVPRKTTVAKGKTRGRTIAGASGGPVALNGQWQDSECIPLTGLAHRPALYVKRQYEFIDTRKAWQLDASVYTSDSCSGNTRLLTYHGRGTFAVTGKSRVASNAYDASFKIDRWTATPQSREGVLTLLNGRCGSGDFQEGRTLDLSASGCPTLGIRSIAQSPREVELVSVSNGKFFLGSRAFIPGLSDDRPAQLSSYGLTRVR